MLTREEETQRAALISGLYVQPSKTPFANRILRQNSFKWSRIFSSSLDLALPYIFANIVYAIFIGLDYHNRQDVAATGIMFIAALIMIGLWMYSALKRFVDSLSDIVINTRSVFWFSCLTLAPAILFLRSFVISDSAKTMTELLWKSSVYLLAAMSVAAIVVMALVYILDRIRLNDIVKITLAVSLTSAPYVIGLLLKLF